MALRSALKVICAVVGLSWALCLQPAVAAPTKRKVLVIYSYNDMMPWQSRIHAGLKDRLEAIAPEDRPEVYEESLDSARLGTAGTGAAIAADLRVKYGSLDFDAVVAESNAATHLLLANPDLFAGARRYAIDPGVDVPAPPPGIEVIQTQGRVAPSLLAIAEILPKLKRLVAVVDHSAIGEALGRRLRAAASALPAGVSFELWDDQSFEELCDEASRLPPDAVFYTPTFVDRTGAHATPRDIAKALAARASVPVFAQHDQYLDTGIVGGRLLSAKTVGVMMADLALGGPHAAGWSEPEKRLNGFVFDRAALKRWGLSEAALPASSTVVGDVSAVWLYRWQIGGAVSVVLLEGCLILWLVTALRQRKAALGELVSERDGLEARVADRTAALSAMANRLEASNAHLRHLADTDALTGTASRRRFLDALEERWRASPADSGPSLLMLDIDRFKAVNDRHGHDAGDRVIRAVADACREQVGEDGFVGRLGGEEFAVLLARSSPSAALERAERIRAAVRACRIAVAPDTVLSVTVSVGVSWRVDADDAPTLALGRADAALYEAKRAGRDRVDCGRGARAAA